MLQIKTFVNRIEFWIVFFFLIRLVGITNPPIEISHSWRQVTGLMVARNFQESDNNILYPRVDDNNGETGIIGMEFPVMNYIYFIFADLFGYSHWYGRLINLIVSTIGLFYFYKIIEKYFGARHAFVSTLCLITSIWFAFSRKMMPDTFCISLMFVSLYSGTGYLESGKKKNLILYFLFLTIALLAKIPAGVYLAVFIPFFFSKNVLLKHKYTFTIATLFALCTMYWWYFIWNPQLSQTYGNWYNGGKPLNEGFSDITNNWKEALEKFYFSAFCGFVFFVCFIAGIFLISKNKKLLFPFLLTTAVFIVYIFKSGYFFYHHNYYIIPYVPVMALVAGFAILQLKKQWMVTLLILGGMAEGIANQQHDFFNKSSEMYKMQLESFADSVSKRNDLVVINGSGNPQQLYLSHRKGWLCNDDQLTDSIYLNKIAKKGCRYIIVNKHSFTGTLQKELVFNNADYSIYKMGEKLNQ